MRELTSLKVISISGGSDVGLASAIISGSILGGLSWGLAGAYLGSTRPNTLILGLLGAQGGTIAALNLYLMISSNNQNTEAKMPAQCSCI